MTETTTREPITLCDDTLQKIGESAQHHGESANHADILAAIDVESARFTRNGSTVPTIVQTAESRYNVELCQRTIVAYLEASHRTRNRCADHVGVFFNALCHANIHAKDAQRIAREGLATNPSLVDAVQCVTNLAWLFWFGVNDKGESAGYRFCDVSDFSIVGEPKTVMMPIGPKPKNAWDTDNRPRKSVVYYPCSVYLDSTDDDGSPISQEYLANVRRDILFDTHHVNGETTHVRKESGAVQFETDDNATRLRSIRFMPADSSPTVAFKRAVLAFRRTEKRQTGTANVSMANAYKITRTVPNDSDNRLAGLNWAINNCGPDGEQVFNMTEWCVGMGILEAGEYGGEASRSLAYANLYRLRSMGELGLEDTVEVVESMDEDCLPIRYDAQRKAKQRIIEKLATIDIPDFD